MMPRAETLDDPYGGAAEFYDLMAQPVWALRSPILLRAFQKVDPALGPLLDVGAGTGLGLELAARVLPTLRIVAVEPSLGMRIALHTRLAARPGLAERTTVVPGTLGDAELPPRLCAALVLGVVGHLPLPERQQLWRLLAERLANGAPALIDVLDRTAPPTRARVRLGSRRVGELSYESWSEGGAEFERWTITYRVLRGERVLRERVLPLRWFRFGLEALGSEVAEFGLSCEPIAADLALLRRKAQGQ
jgi:hypothetical protein